MHVLTADHEEWERHASGERRAGARDEVLSRSWERARESGVPVGAADEGFVGRGEVAERRERGERVWGAARPVLEELTAQLERGGFVGIWADADGVILHQLAGGTFLTTAQRLELIAGARWGEGARGTNAIGTAIAQGDGVAVLGSAHSQQPNHGLVCYASPVRGATGEIVGVIDVTSRLECAHELASAAVLSARRAIEAELRARAYAPGGFSALTYAVEACGQPAVLVERGAGVRAASKQALERFGANLAGVQAATGWARLRALASSPDPRVELEDARGRAASWRVMVRWVGGEGASRAHAALVVFEPVAAFEAARPAAPSAREACAFSRMYGTDSGFERAKRLTARFAGTSLPLMILAETGTGKDRFARAAHEMSERADGAFVALNCGAITKDLMESELFGHAPGAFTGASAAGSEGKLAAAHGGTLFLDELAEMPMGAQAALLRFLEDGSYYRVGEAKPRRADVRVVAATCRDLPEQVRQGSFRADLFYRLKGARVTIPPLREREDVLELARGLMRDLCAELGDPVVPTLSEEAAKAVRAYAWPGNVRELKNALHVALVLGDGAPELGLDVLPDEVARCAERSASSRAGKILDRAEEQALREALDAAGGNMSDAARRLGVARSTLYRMLERHGMR
jgi:transcriptional regulator of acetoin/glycerol metabolism